MKKLIVIAVATGASFALAGCGNTPEQRAWSGAGLGGATGAAIGGLAGRNVGTAVAGGVIGAAAGAAVGANTRGPDQR